jgi:hypothetical protein
MNCVTKYCWKFNERLRGILFEPFEQWDREMKQNTVELTKLTGRTYNIGEEHGSDEEEAVLQCA